MIEERYSPDYHATTYVKLVMGSWARFNSDHHAAQGCTSAEINQLASNCGCKSQI